MRENQILKTGIFNIVFQFAYLVFIYLFWRDVPLAVVSGTRFLILAGFVLLPSIIWVMFYYLQDRLEPEPPFYVLACFLAGMSASGIFAGPLNMRIFHVKDWLYADRTYFILGSFLVTASVGGILIYLIVRYGFLPLEEFHEPVDGMVYGATAGAGFAFVLSLEQLLAHPDYTLFSIAYTAFINILIYSAVGSKVGEVLGRARFRKSNLDASSLKAIFFGILLLGVYHLLNEIIFISGLTQIFWLSIMLTVLYSLLIILGCFIQMKKLTSKHHHGARKRINRFDLGTSAVILLILFSASVVSSAGIRGRKISSQDAELEFYVPFSLQPFSLSMPDFRRSLHFFGPSSKLLFFGGSGRPEFFLFVQKHPAKLESRPMDLMHYVDKTKTESLKVEDKEENGKKWTRISYSFLEKAGPGLEEFPKLMEVYSDIFRGSKMVYVFEFRVPTRYSLEARPVYEKILKSIKWTGGGVAE